ncbi:MAG: hypothetical protein DHS80DRAFT_21210 [Piptocephalis tieghemiana]|nr:MAG: hypothetical protein DHS80DRAFT_21210 [Piptocephalis tieghemiana]
MFLPKLVRLSLIGFLSIPTQLSLANKQEEWSSSKDTLIHPTSQYTQTQLDQLVSQRPYHQKHDQEYTSYLTRSKSVIRKDRPYYRMKRTSANQKAVARKERKKNNLSTVAHGLFWTGATALIGSLTYKTIHKHSKRLLITQRQRKENRRIREAHNSELAGDYFRGHPSKPDHPSTHVKSRPSADPKGRHVDHPKKKQVFNLEKRIGRKPTHPPSDNTFSESSSRHAIQKGNNTHVSIGHPSWAESPLETDTSHHHSDDPF